MPDRPDPDPATGAQRVLLLGATGTIGRATATALVAEGHDVVALVRPGAETTALPGCTLREGQVTEPGAVTRDAIRGEAFDAVISCIASRTGAPADAWAVDHAANMQALAAAQSAGIGHFILLSAICVQKPLLEFQRAKLAFEARLRESGIDWSIVRPTAYFKSLSGQVDRLRRGKPFLVFGDGTLTACKPISDADLGRYLSGCLTDPARRNRMLPIGGPGPAITPLEQGRLLFDALGRAPHFKRVPVRLLDGIAGTLSALGRVSPAAASRAELARIGRYYATQSMLVWTGSAYDADATPEFGSTTLADHYARLARGDVKDDRGAHAVF